jgi:hypothetical protein
MNTTPTVLGYPGFREGHGLGTDAWRHTSCNNLNEPNSYDDETWKIWNEIAEEERILRNRMELLQEKEALLQEKKRAFETAKNSNYPENATTFNQSKQISPNILQLVNRRYTPGGKSRRVFRKNTKITRRRNKKSNRSRSHHRHHHHHRRTSHVAKQT